MEILKYLLKILFSPLYLIDKLTLKRNVWIFGSRNGNQYNDNTKAMYEYCCKQKSNTKFIWLTKNKDLCKNLNNEGKECHLFFSMKGIYYGIVAKVAFICISRTDLPLTTYIFRSKKIMQLWHGTPLKKLELKAGPLMIRILRFLLITYLGREYDYVISSGKINDKIYQDIFCVKHEQIKNLGQPRNDVLFEIPKINFDKKYQKTFIYMPTYRNYEYNIFEGFEESGIKEFLKKNNCLFALKLHSIDRKKYQNIINFENTMMIDGTADPYEIIGGFDVLITDYSSIYFDFLLLDKSIIFTPFDKKEYLENQGLYYEYDDVTPGAKAYNWEDTIKCMQEILIEDKYIDNRKDINKMFNEHIDNKSAERIYNFTNNLL